MNDLDFEIDLTKFYPLDNDPMVDNLLKKGKYNDIKNPIIGWFGRKQLGYVVIFIIFFLLFYFVFYKKQKPIDSIGCMRNSCTATPCYGPECQGDNCVGIGCHAGDCYGEACSGGTCEGAGCKGGDCYGTNCVPGTCKDPNCLPPQEQAGLCKPNCSWGRAYRLQESSIDMYKKIKPKLPQNTYLNRNLCIKPNYITEKLVSDDKTLYNFAIKGANYYNGSYLSLSEINAKIKLGTVINDVKGLVRNSDPIISTVNPIFKGSNCNWCSTFNEKEICANLQNNYNFNNASGIDNYSYNWTKLNKNVVLLDTKGNEIPCPGLLMMGPHTLNNVLNVNLDINQIKNILGLQTLDSRMNNIDTITNLLNTKQYSTIYAYMKNTDFRSDLNTVDLIVSSIDNFSNLKYIYSEIEKIRGTIITASCLNCSAQGSRTVMNDYFPVDILGNILPCIGRAYIYDMTKIAYDQNKPKDVNVSYTLKDFKKSGLNGFSETDKEPFINEIHSIKNNHLMLYLGTDYKKKTVQYICFFCKQISSIKLNDIITTNCSAPDDFNHYYISLLNSLEQVYYKCIKCNKTTID
jgi:hypothetical protein